MPLHDLGESRLEHVHPALEAAEGVRAGGARIGREFLQQAIEFGRHLGFLAHAAFAVGCLSISLRLGIVFPRRPDWEWCCLSPLSPPAALEALKICRRQNGSVCGSI
jgi:hypothetical protein